MKNILKNILKNIRWGANIVSATDEFAHMTEIRETEHKDSMRWFCGMNELKTAYPCNLL